MTTLVSLKSSVAIFYMVSLALIVHMVKQIQKPLGPKRTNTDDEVQNGLQVIIAIFTQHAANIDWEVNMQ